MHPVEHLYYLATVFPSVVFTLSPFHFLWNGMHAVISPAAGHSGWEDHWQSDQHHYIHHARFECNYGGGGIPIDAFFGTLRDTLSGHDKLYKGKSGSTCLPAQLAEAGDAETEFKLQNNRNHAPGFGTPPNYEMPTAMESLNPLPRSRDGAYWVGVLAIFGTLGCALACHPSPHSTTSTTCSGLGFLQLASLDYTTTVPILVAWGPVAWGAILNGVLGDRYAMLWPFEKDPIGRTLTHLFVGTLFCQFVVYQSLAMYFKSPYVVPTPVLGTDAISAAAVNIFGYMYGQ